MRSDYESLIFFLLFYVMSLNNLLVFNVKRKLLRRDSSESSSGSPVEKRLKELVSEEGIELLEGCSGRVG